MIKVQSISNTDGNEHTATVSLFADTKEEVIPGATIIGLPQGVTLEMGSSVMTASGEVAFMKSDGNWNWV